ncbi:hypothetical protein QQ045_020992 [Rhodiola kirilowii]
MEATPNATGATSATNAGNGSMMPPVNDVAASFDAIRRSETEPIGLLHQLYLTVSSFNFASQLPLLQRLNSLVV